jgi:hypothetical protein
MLLNIDFLLGTLVLVGGIVSITVNGYHAVFVPASVPPAVSPSAPWKEEKSAKKNEEEDQEERKVEGCKKDSRPHK